MAAATKPESGTKDKNYDLITGHAALPRARLAARSVRARRRPRGRPGSRCALPADARAQPARCRGIEEAPPRSAEGGDVTLVRFRDRTHAGQVLAERLKAYAGYRDLLVLGLPRGGVPVAFEVAEALDAQFDVFVVRKLGVPGHEELAMGAIASGGVRVLNDPVVAALDIDEETIARAAAADNAELERRERAYRGERGPVEVAGRTVIIVDDGIATGSTMRAAVHAVGSQGPERVVVAVPVAAEQTCAELRAEADETVCVLTPEPFGAVGLWYDDFAPISEAAVRDLLEQAHERSATTGR